MKQGHLRKLRCPAKAKAQTAEKRIANLKTIYLFAFFNSSSQSFQMFWERHRRLSAVDEEGRGV
jgi:hypothetical protein